MAKDEKKQQTEAVATLHDNTISPRDKRRARGQVLREAVPFQKHADWSIHPDRPNIIDVLQQAEDGRIEELVPIRYGRMMKTPFTFFRGGADIMAFDLSHTPNIKTSVQVCGDAHALNFGAFATPERNVVFDINDFDETLPGPWEWDVKRLAVSLMLIARDNGLKVKAGLDAVKSCVESYRQRMQEYSKMAVLDIWYAKVEWEHIIQSSQSSTLGKSLKDDLKKAKKKSIQYHYFPKLTEERDGKFHIKDNPPLIYHPDDKGKFSKTIMEGLKLYRNSLQEDKQRLFDRYRIEDVAIKVVGIGSVGTTCAVALALAPDDEPLFFQIKEARASVLEKYVGKSTYDTHGQRVVAGQRIIQSASDIFLGWMVLENGKHFYVRQLRDTKVKLTPETWEDNHLEEMSKVLGAALARAHARSGDSTVIASYLGDTDEFDTAIANFATVYSDQVEKDHAALIAAIGSGKLKAQELEE